MGSTTEDISLLISQTEVFNCTVDVLELALDVAFALDSSNLLLVGKLLSNRGINKNALRSISRAWNILHGLTITELNPNIFLFGFTTEIERDRSFSARPWSVMGSHLVLKYWSPSLTIEEVDFSVSPFWVQIHGLPPSHKTLSNATRIGAIAGLSPHVDFPSKEALVRSQFLRVKVELNVLNSLKTGFFFPKGHFFLKYGFHSGKPLQGVLAYGPWLRAESGKFSSSDIVLLPGDNSQLVAVPASVPLVIARKLHAFRKAQGQPVHTELLKEVGKMVNEEPR
ncbi:hypothetical protein L1049_012311 [Liquidambar formosana]|uniref:DUF4283 domain-containing protein n=1 Tax=Liquidambar formosana TaxID=63359 RepID=A0AAP0X0F3_LIQFO